MVNRDPRYDLIKGLYERGKIESLNDIYKYVPKTRVATDLGKKVDRFNKYIEHVGEFTLDELSIIGSFCELEDEEIFDLATKEFVIQKEQRTTNGKNAT